MLGFNLHKKTKQKLHNIKPDEVSFVAKPAIGRPFLLLKGDEDIFFDETLGNPGDVVDNELCVPEEPVDEHTPGSSDFPDIESDDNTNSESQARDADNSPKPAPGFVKVLDSKQVFGQDGPNKDDSNEADFKRWPTVHRRPIEEPEEKPDKFPSIRLD